MTDRAATHDKTEAAVLYALGALSQHEARSFEEHLGEGCETCRAEFETFEITVRALGFGAPDAEPPTRARADLVARIAASTAEQSVEARQRVDDVPFVSIRSSEGRWRELMKGVLLKKLHVDPATGIATSLVRMMPGTALPIHRHTGVEQFYVIEGDCYVAGQMLSSGDYHRAEAGSTHATTSTVNGTLLLLIAPEHYEVLDGR